MIYQCIVLEKQPVLMPTVNTSAVAKVHRLFGAFQKLFKDIEFWTPRQALN